jgi:hypothetical protein
VLGDSDDAIESAGNVIIHKWCLVQPAAFTS